jgi:hypothetical protein
MKVEGENLGASPHQPHGVMACPGATCLEYVSIDVIFRKRRLLNSSHASQVWAREYWSSGVMGRKGAKKLFLYSSKPIPPLLQYSNRSIASKRLPIFPPIIVPSGGHGHILWSGCQMAQVRSRHMVSQRCHMALSWRDRNSDIFNYASADLRKSPCLRKQ